MNPQFPVPLNENKLNESDVKEMPAWFKTPLDYINKIAETLFYAQEVNILDIFIKLNQTLTALLDWLKGSGGGVEPYLDSLGGSDGDVLTKTSGGYDMEPYASTDSNALGSYVQDDFDLLDSSKYKPTDTSSINRADFNSSLLAKLLKNVTSLTPGTDRVDIVGHGLSDGQKVKFGFSGGGITALTEYYVRNKTTDDFQLSTDLTGGILDLTSDQTGEMLTNVAWGFGNGSTTLNTPDLNGKFLRPAGVSSTSQKANGSYYDGGAVGESKLDKFQGHIHPAEGEANDGASVTQFQATGTGSPSAGSWTFNGYDPGADGNGNGTPRTGDETAPVSIAVKYKVRIA